MIDIFSFILGFILGYLLSVFLVYFWIRRYVGRILKEGQALENLLKIIQEKKK